jgi:Uma2 family endonuclease
MALPKIQPDEKWSYREYHDWPDDERWEIIDGIVYDMSPAPSPKHQDIAGEIFRELATFLLDKPCKVYIAPFDIRLPEADETGDDASNVVQPDIVVICDRVKLDHAGCVGAPDLVVEILSPSTSRKDQKEKFLLYERHGVKEYWIVNPTAQVVHVYRLGSDNRYGRPDIYGPEDKPVVGILPELVIDLPLVFRE